MKSNVVLASKSPRNAYPWEMHWYKISLFELIQKAIEAKRRSHSRLTHSSIRPWYHISIHRIERFTSSFEEIGVQLNIGKNMWGFYP